MKDIEAKNIVEEHELLQGRVDALESENQDFKSQIDNLSAENSAFQERVEELEKIKVDLESSLESLNASNEELEDQVEKLTQEEISGTEKAITILESVAVEPVEQGKIEAEEVDAYSKYKEITDPAEKVAFYRKHKEQILGGLK
jgi:predicted nuclease with TOPRIM domain